MSKNQLFTLINKCFSSQKNTFNELKEEIINNITAIDLTSCEISQSDLQKLKESNGRKLIITRPKFRQHFRENFYSRLVLNKIVKKKGYNYDDIKHTNECTFTTIEDVIAECTKIFVAKQKELL